MEEEGKGGNDKSKGFKSWRSTPPAAGDPQTKPANGKNFMWCATCKRWTTTHSTATHTGGKKASDGSNGGAAVNNVSLVYDPSVWTTEATVAPSVTDVLYALCTMATRMSPLLMVLLTYVMAISSVPFAKTMWSSTLENIQLTMAQFYAVNWNQVIAIIQVHVMIVCSHVLQFLDTHQVALIALFLWILLATIVLFWLPKFTSTPPEPDPKDAPTRRHRCALKQHNRKVTRRANAPVVGSIRFHGLHRNVSTLTCDPWDTTFEGMHQPWLNNSSKCS